MCLRRGFKEFSDKLLKLILKFMILKGHWRQVTVKNIIAFLYIFNEKLKFEMWK